MPTRIVGVNPAQDLSGAGDTWGAIGSGLQGIGDIWMAANMEKQRNKAAAAGRDADLMARSKFDSSLGGAMPAGAQPTVAAQTAAQPPSAPLAVTSLTRSPMEMTPRVAANVDVNASVPPINLELPGLVRSLSPETLSAAARPPMAGGGGAGFQSLFATQFPSLFPQSASQYGGM